MQSRTASGHTYASRTRELICGVALVLTSIAGASVQAQTTPESVSSRGELLYSTHCIECHTTQIHWRANRRAVDWETLKFQVRRWQGVLNLNWTEADADDVAHYLNDTIYRFPRQVSRGVGQPGLMPAREPNCSRSAAALSTLPLLN
jgi:mono/diheme cytochrome c family protein